MTELWDIDPIKNKKYIDTMIKKGNALDVKEVVACFDFAFSRGRGVLETESLKMAGMINCMRFRPKEGQAEALFKAFAEYVRDYPFDDIMHKIIDLGTGEFALIGVHHSVDSFIDIMNRDNRVSDMMRQFVEPYEDGESFHSFSGPVVNFNDYL